jgi:hypothetical protein
MERVGAVIEQMKRAGLHPGVLPNTAPIDVTEYEGEESNASGNSVMSSSVSVSTQVAPDTQRSGNTLPTDGTEPPNPLPHTE